MEFKDVIKERKSIRGYLDRPVEKEVVEELLQTASRSVSALNGQPWRIHVVTGEVKNAIGRMNEEAFLSGIEEDTKDPAMTGDGRARMIGVAKQLFKAMEIAREDKEKRLWWTRRGFRFFDAPVGILISIGKDFEKEFHRLDIGAFMQTFALAAADKGLGTCIELQAVNYLGGIRKYIDFEEGEEFVIGIALGYPDPDFPANDVVTEREDILSLTSWYGFE